MDEEDEEDHHPHSRHPSLLHSFTPGLKPTFSTNSSHFRLLLPTYETTDNRDELTTE